MLVPFVSHLHDVSRDLDSFLINGWTHDLSYGIAVGKPEDS